MRRFLLRISAASVVVCFPALAGEPAAAGEGIAIEKAIDLALKQNRNLRLLELSLDSARLSVQGARADFAVRVTPDGSALSSDDSDTLDYGLSVAKNTTWGTQASVDGQVSQTDSGGATNFHRATVRLELRQPLLRRFGPLVNREPVSQAESQVDATRRELELRKTDLVVQVVETYEDLLKLQRQVEFDRQALNRLEKLLRLTQARERQGRSSHVDVLRVEQQKGDAEIHRNQTLERLQSVRADFADLLGFPAEHVFLAVPEPMLTVETSDSRQAASVALENRLDYAQVLQDCRDAERGVRIARRNLLPDLNLISRYERSGEGSTASGATDLNDDSWFVGLTLESDLNRRKERVALGQAVISEKTARQTIGIVESGVRRQVRQALATYERARSEVVFAERNLQFAQSRATLARRLYEIGRGDNFSATDAESALSQAQNQMLSAQAEASVAAYRLLRSMGTLIEYPEDLKPAPETAKSEARNSKS